MKNLIQTDDQLENLRRQLATGALIYTSPFDIGATVYLDNGDIQLRVIGLRWYGSRMEIEVSWWNNGSLNTAWVCHNRLTRERSR